MTAAADHLVVRASAGAGKTFALSSRYLKLLHSGGAPSTILATTFTRKAAGEILGRVLRRLADGAVDEAAAKKLGAELEVTLSLGDARRMLTEAVRSLHRVSISTIDSFFNRMVQCFRHELDIPPNVSLVAEDDPAARRLRYDAIEALLADDSPDTLVALLRRLHHDNAQRSVTDAIDRIVRSLYDLYRQTTPDAWSQLVAPPGLPATLQADALIALQETVGRATEKRVAKALSGNYAAAAAHQWEDFLTGGLAKRIVEAEVLAEGPTFYGKAIATELVAVYRPLVAHAKAVVVGRVAERTRAMHDLLRQFDAHYTRLRRGARIMLFSDLPQKLARELPKLGDGLSEHLYYRLDARVAHLLLDEFQDTSVEQWQVLRPMAQEIRAHGDVEFAGTPGSRTFFCVGDVKQAIYGWRGGCAAIFDQVERDLGLPEGGGETLRKSYRSSQVVLDAVNRLFGDIGEHAVLESHRETARDWQRGFRDHVANDMRLPGYVELRTTVTGDPSAHAPAPGSSDDGVDGHDSDGSGNEAVSPHQAFVARYIHDSIAPALTTGARDIGVLVRTNDTARRLLYQLRSLGLNVSGEGGSPIIDDPAVGVILSALLMADHPGHAAAAFHVVNSPLGAIVGLASTRADAVAQVSLNIRRQLASDGYARTLTSWARKLAGDCDARGVTRLTQLIELAEAHDASSPGLRTRDFIEQVRAASVEEPTSASIRVMTVHKAKGLEFDVVVLPDLQGLIGRASDAAAWAWRASETDAPRMVFATAPQAVCDIIAPLCPQYPEARQQETRRRLHDDLSALYVAMTRARFALHMLIEPIALTPSGKPSTRGVTNLSCASLLRSSLCDVEESYEANQVLYSHGDVSWCEAMRKVRPVTAGRHATASAPRPLRVSMSAGEKVDATATRVRRSWRIVTPSALEAEGRVRVDDLLSISDKDSRMRGSVIHACFALVEWLDGGVPAPHDPALLAAGRRAAANATEPQLRRWIDEFKHMLEAPNTRAALCRASVSGGAATDAGSVQVWRERSFAVRIADRLVQGTFDRVVMSFDASGRPTRAQLIDFKTDSATDEDVAAGLIKRYTPQIEAYREALAAMSGLPVERVEASLLLLSVDRACPMAP